MKFSACVICILILMLGGAACCVAQAVPNAINYQGKLTDSTGKAVPDAAYSVQFKLYSSDTGGTAFWTSTAQNVQTMGGLFSTQLSVTPTDLSTASAAWLETIVAGQVLSPRVQFVSVPYALWANKLTLPFSGSTATPSANTDAFGIHSQGQGDAVNGYAEGVIGAAAYFQTVSSSNSRGTVYINNAGSGSGLTVTNQSISTGMSAISATTAGTGAAIKASGTIAGEFQGKVGIGISNPAATLEVLSNLRLPAYFHTDSSTGSWHALDAATSGLGDAGNFQVKNSASNASGIFVAHNGYGNSVLGYMSGLGRAGYFQIDNASSSSTALECTTNGTGTAFKATGPVAGDFQGLLKTTGFRLGTSATAGQILKTDASGVGTWQNESLTLPFVATAPAGPSSAFEIDNPGTGSAIAAYANGTSGNAAYLTTTNASNSSSSLSIMDFGTGSAITATATNNNSSSPAIVASHAGTGDGLDITLSNASSYGSGISVSHVGTGHGIHSTMTGMGQAGYFYIGNSSNNSAALECRTTGIGYALRATGTIAADFEGKVGIGTVAPSQMLDVVGTAKMTGFKLGTSATAGQVLTTDSSGTGTWQAIPGLADGSVTNQKLAADPASLNKVSGGYMSILNGFVGVGGISNPAYPLHVYSYGNTAGMFEQSSSGSTAHGLDVYTNGLGDACNFTINNAANNNSGIFIADNGTGNGLLSYMSGTGRAGYFQISKSASSATALECTTNGTGAAFKAQATIAADFEGKVGIGTANPGYPLDVNGYIRATNLTVPSDVRFKTNIRTIADALESIDQLRGVTYDWKSQSVGDMEFPEGKQIGFIAQEIEKVFPEIVSTDNNGYKSVEYQKVVPVLVEAVKTLDNQNKAKDAKIADLESRLERLEKLVLEQKGGK